MPKKETEKVELTAEEKQILTNMLSAYYETIDNDEVSRGVFMELAHEIGEIASMGEKYVNNKRFFDVSDAIRVHLEAKKDKARQLYRKLLFGYHLKQQP